MDIFTGDMENWRHHSEVDDTRHAAMLGDILAERDFSAHEDSSNISYAFEMTKWVISHFEYITEVHSDEIEGDELPLPIKALVAREWAPGGESRIVYPSGSTILMKHETEELRKSGPSTLEKFIKEIRAKDNNVFQDTEDLQALADLDGDLLPSHFATKSEVEIFETITLNWFYPSFDPSYGRSGIRIDINPGRIEAFSFGAPEQAPKLQTFVKHLYNYPSELSAIASEFAVLAARHTSHRVSSYFTDRSEIENFAAHLRTF